MFGVPTQEWEKYVQKDMRKTMLCRECYDFIVESVNRHEKKQ